MVNVLIVDDEPEIRSMMCDLLEFAGYVVQVAEDGASAFQIVQAHPVDLVVSDVMMPNMGGLELLQRMRAIPEIAPIPVILVTALGQRPNIRTGMDLGADDYLSKPFEPNELLSAVESRLKKHEIIQSSYESELDDLRSNIAYALPHEFLTPLNIILGYAYLLISDEGKSPSEFVLESARATHTAAKRLQHLTENYQLFSQLEMILYDRRRLDALRQEQTLFAHDVVESTARGRAIEHGREDDLTLDLRGLTARTSYHAMQHLVYELTDNAFRYSEPGTPVVVKTWTQTSQFHFQVEDKGRGFSPIALKRLGAFMQFDRKEFEQQGMGLGLAISKLLTTIYCGELDIETNIDQGTLVHVQMRA